METAEISVIMEKVVLGEYIGQFAPAVRNLFYGAYGKNLEAMPPELLQPDGGMERFLENLLALNNERSQKIILMRSGIATGVPMSLSETANALGIPPDRVRQTERMFFSRFRPRVHRHRFRKQNA